MHESAHIRMHVFISVCMYVHITHNIHLRALRAIMLPRLGVTRRAIVECVYVRAMQMILVTSYVYRV